MCNIYDILRSLEKPQNFWGFYNYSGDWFSSTQMCCSLIPCRTQHSFLSTLHKFCNKHMFCIVQMSMEATEVYSWKPVIHFSRYATVDLLMSLAATWTKQGGSNLDYAAKYTYWIVFSSISSPYSALCSLSFCFHFAFLSLPAKGNSVLLWHALIQL